MTSSPANQPPVPPVPAARQPRRRKGVFQPNRVRFVSFAVIALALFATGMLCVLAIWDYASRDTAWRAIATLGVVVGTMLTFTLINEAFGARLEV